MSKIEWTGISWNFITGCNKISQGCKNCYAERMTKRLKAMGQAKYADGFGVIKTHSLELERPYHWKKPQLVFVNSMSDTFHHKVPLTFLQLAFQVMRENSQHTFQVLTKRAERLADISDYLPWAPNIWMGVSVENQATLERINYLKACSAHVKFLSIEPLLGPLPDLDLSGIDWVIVGGESGPKSRPIEKEWILPIRDQCIERGIPFFFKQWGGTNKKKSGRRLEGKIYDQMPPIAR